MDDSLDFVYIDANHAFDAVNRDLRKWFPKLRNGGVFAGHDYFDAWADETLEPLFRDVREAIPAGDLTSYGVKSAVDQFSHEVGLRLFVTDETFPTWYCVKL